MSPFITCSLLRIYIAQASRLFAFVIILITKPASAKAKAGKKQGGIYEAKR